MSLFDESTPHDVVKVDRLPPNSIEAEQGVLGCCLWDPAEIGPDMRAKLTTDTFYDLRHQTIFDVMSEMMDDLKTIDIISLMQTLRDKDLLDKIGGVAYLNALQDSVPSPANFSYYCEIMKEKHKLRTVVRTCTNIVGNVYESENADTVLDECEKLMLELSSMRTESKRRNIKEIVHDVINEVEESFANKGKITGLPTGFPTWDRISDGLQSTDMIVIAARPSMGKTALAMTMAAPQSLDLKAPVGVFSFEMSANQLVKRMMAVDGRVSIRKLRDGDMQDRDFPKLTKAAGRLSNSQIDIEESDVTMLKLRSLARQGVSRHGWKAIYIDYIQLMSFSDQKFNNRNEEMTKISNSIKAMAKELDIPVIVLCQLNREADKHGGQPQLSHLKDCGAIEQDADVVGFIYSDKPDQDEEAEAVSRMFKVAKDRNGEAPVFIPLTLLKPFTRFESRTDIDEEDIPR